MLQKSGAVRSVDLILFSLGRRPAGDWASAWLDKTFYSIFFKREVVATSVTSSLSCYSRRTLLET